MPPLTDKGAIFYPQGLLKVAPATTSPSAPPLARGGELWVKLGSAGAKRLQNPISLFFPFPPGRG